MLGHRTLLAFIASLPDRIGRPATRTPYIPQIDGLRCLAIAFVLLWHTSLRANRFVNSLMDDGQDICNWYYWFPHGEVGVALFFFISGYVIAQPFLSRPRETWRVGNFYLQRFWRIYPPYVVAVTICMLIVAAAGFGSATYSMSITNSWIVSLFYLHGLIYDTSSRLNPPIWSLEIEIQFYLLAPLLLQIYLWTRRSNARLVIGCVCVALLIVAAGLLEGWQPFDGRYRFGLLAHMYLFVAGIVAADFVRSRAISAEAVFAGFDLLFVAGSVSLVFIGLYMTQVDAKPSGGLPAILCNLGLLTAVLASYFGTMHGHISRRIMGAPWIVLAGCVTRFISSVLL